MHEPEGCPAKEIKKAKVKGSDDEIQALIEWNWMCIFHILSPSVNAVTRRIQVTVVQASIGGFLFCILSTEEPKDQKILFNQLRRAVAMLAPFFAPALKTRRPMEQHFYIGSTVTAEITSCGYLCC